ncbi:MAG: helix-turn-helix domain-containing protein [Gemmatimonadales bacterium]|nr:helix-turn-helix domain-containing protein [Gemmatimonadales bacterium]
MRYGIAEDAMEAPEISREITATAAAVLLGLSRERVVRLVQRGQLRGRRTADGAWLVERAAVETWRAGPASDRDRRP